MRGSVVVVFAQQTAVAGGVRSAVFSVVEVVDVAVDRFLVAAGPAAVLIARGDGPEQGVGDGGGHHLVAADGAVLVEHQPQELRGAGERFEGLVVDVGAVEELRAGVVGASRRWW